MSRHIQLPGRRVRTGRFASIRGTALQLSRQQAIAELGSGGEYDVLVIGGGVTGSYVALDCATRGLRVALVEKDDFASGTSSKSSKMVHGGLRYIEQGNLGLVRHSLLERQRLRTNAPHLVQRLPFLFPVLAHDGVFDPRLAKAFQGLLWTYDLAGGWRIGRLHQRLTVAEVLSRAPLLAGSDVRGGFLYYDCRADDARLTLTIARTAAHYGATLLNGARVTGLIEGDGLVRGARVDTGAAQVDVQARVVVNATGVWSDTVDALADPAHESRVRPGKGGCGSTAPSPCRSRGGAGVPPAPVGATASSSASLTPTTTARWTTCSALGTRCGSCSTGSTRRSARTCPKVT